MKLVNESKPGELASLEEVVASLVKDWSNSKSKEPNYLDPEVCADFDAIRLVSL